jgi:RNA-directed DNA polymerase
VTQQNKGKHTPRVDGVIIDTPEAHVQLLQENLFLKDYRPKPVRRVYIPKSNGKVRPLGTAGFITAVVFGGLIFYITLRFMVM